MRWIVLTLALVGCGTPKNKKPPPPETYYKRYCVTPEQKEKLRTWTSQCIRDVDPGKDDDPEDWIKQCEKSGVEINCDKVIGLKRRPCPSCIPEFTPCAAMKDLEGKAHCSRAGWDSLTSELLIDTP